MRRNWKNEFNEVRYECRQHVRSGHQCEFRGIKQSLTKYGKKVFQEELRKFRRDYELDRKLGILDNESYDELLKIDRMIVNTIANAEIY